MVDRFIVVETVAGRMEADLVRSFLNARRIKCELSQESASDLSDRSISWFQ